MKRTVLVFLLAITLMAMINAGQEVIPIDVYCQGNDNPLTYVYSSVSSIGSWDTSFESQCVTISVAQAPYVGTAVSPVWFTFTGIHEASPYVYMSSTGKVVYPLGVFPWGSYVGVQSRITIRGSPQLLCGLLTTYIATILVELSEAPTCRFILPIFQSNTSPTNRIYSSCLIEGSVTLEGTSTVQVTGGVNIDSMPSVNVATMPSISVETMPPVIISSLPSVVISRLPSVDISSLPPVQVSSLPAVDISTMPGVTVVNFNRITNVTQVLPGIIRIIKSGDTYQFKDNTGTSVCKSYTNLNSLTIYIVGSALIRLSLVDAFKAVNYIITDMAISDEHSTKTSKVKTIQMDQQQVMFQMCLITLDSDEATDDTIIANIMLYYP